MADIVEILKQSGVEIPEENKETFLKEFRESYKSTAELNKIKEKKESLESRISELNQVVDGYKKVDLDGLKQEISDWKTKYENADKEYTAKFNKQLLTTAFNNFKFSSNTAKEGIFAKALSSDKIKFENDTVKGLDDFIKEMKEQDAGAFAAEPEEEKAPKYSRSITSKPNQTYGDPSKMDYSTYKKWRKSQKNN